MKNRVNKILQHRSHSIWDKLQKNWWISSFYFSLELWLVCAVNNKPKLNKHYLINRKSFPNQCFSFTSCSFDLYYFLCWVFLFFVILDTGWWWSNRDKDRTCVSHLMCHNVLCNWWWDLSWNKKDEYANIRAFSPRSSPIFAKINNTSLRRKIPKVFAYEKLPLKLFPHTNFS
jgi:hypothetical protein